MGEQYFNKISIEKRIAELRVIEKACTAALKDYIFYEVLNKKTQAKKK